MCVCARASTLRGFTFFGWCLITPHTQENLFLLNESAAMANVNLIEKIYNKIILKKSVLVGRKIPESHPK